MEMIWGLALEQEPARILEETLQTDYCFRNWDVDSLPDSGQQDHSPPLLLVVGWEQWKNFPATYKQFLKNSHSSQCVLLLRQSERLDSSEVVDICSAGFLAVLTEPYDRDRIHEIVLMAGETRSLYADILNMTNEINLERELLSRKNAQLEFLSRFMTRTAQSLDINCILSRAREDLGRLLDVREIGVVFWKKVHRHQAEADLFLPSGCDRTIQDTWIEHLLSGATRLSGKTVSCYTINFVPSASSGWCSLPDPETSILLPLTVEGETFGLMTLVSDDVSTLGRDRMGILQTAARHLALALKNGLLFCRMKTLADHDGLTRIHNRQHFDQTMLVELKRHQRQGETLTVLMLDLDHFKTINDTYGHQAGDMVLREVGRLLTSTLRESDYPARYGGEEFVVILPHTNEEQAWHLAQRIRRKLASMTFEYRGKNFQVTTSIGIASVAPSSLQPPSELIRMADSALYMAKSGGRNMVCSSAPESPREVNC
ncbi:MAG: diguanylate cyclase [Desulfovibrionales bacterium]